MKGLTFDSEKHLFWFNGKWVPSVTQVLKQTGLIDGRYYTEGARNRGSHVHKAIEYYEGGVLDWDSLNPKVEKYLAAYLAWKADAKIGRITKREAHVFHRPLWYAGILDLKTRVEGRVAIVDVKSGEPEWWHDLQCGAYALAEGTEAAWRLYLKPNGRYRFEPVALGLAQEAWLHVCKAHNMSVQGRMIA